MRWGETKPIIDPSIVDFGMVDVIETLGFKWKPAAAKIAATRQPDVTTATIYF